MLKELSRDLWQSDLADAQSLFESGRWKTLGIRGVLCPAFNVRLAYPAEVASLVLPVWDDTAVPGSWYEEAVRFRRLFSPLVVHCAGGLNRSSAFAAACLVGDGLALERAFERVTAVPWDNALRASLVAWYHTWMAARHERLA